MWETSPKEERVTLKHVFSTISFKPCFISWLMSSPMRISVKFVGACELELEGGMVGGVRSPTSWEVAPPPWDHLTQLSVNPINHSSNVGGAP